MHIITQREKVYFSRFFISPGIDTPGPENYPLYRQPNVNNMMKDMIAEDREAEERVTSIPDRSRCESLMPQGYT